MTEQHVRYVETEVLRIAYLETGPGDGWPVILSHGFPYDAHAYDAVAPLHRCDRSLGNARWGHLSLWRPELAPVREARHAVER